MFIRNNKIRIIIILQPVDGATDGATRRVICPASLYYNSPLSVGASKPVAYPELVSRGVSKTRKSKWLVKVGASIYQTPDLKQNLGWGGFRVTKKNLDTLLQTAGRTCPIVSGDVSKCSYRLKTLPVTSSRLSSA